jgi:hypothetical protein
MRLDDVPFATPEDLDPRGCDTAAHMSCRTGPGAGRRSAAIATSAIFGHETRRLWGRAPEPAAKPTSRGALPGQG